MKAFEAFSSNLEAKPMRKMEAESPENFDKNELAFEAFSSHLEAKPLREMGAEPPENFSK